MFQTLRRIAAALEDLVDLHRREQANYEAFDVQQQDMLRMMREVNGRNAAMLELAKETRAKSEAHQAECRDIHRRLLEHAGLTGEPPPTVN